MTLTNCKIKEEGTKCSRGWMYKQLCLVVESVNKPVKRKAFSNAQRAKIRME